MAKNDLPSSTVAYITLITRVFWSFLGGHGGDDIFIIFMIKWWDIIFDKSSTFIENGTGQRYSSHDEGPASTARFTGGQVISKKTSKIER